jgi:hypothetical protein
MNAFGVFSVIVILFVTYQLLRVVYNMADKKYREGYSTCGGEQNAGHYDGFH